MLQGIEPVLIGAGGDDVTVELGGGVEVVVVVVEPGGAEAGGLLRGQHPKGHTGLHAEAAHPLDHLQYVGHVPLPGVAPGGPHAEAGRAVGPGLTGPLQHLFHFHQPLGLESGMIAGALGAILAILRTGAGLDGEQGADLHLVRIEMGAVNGLGLEHQIVERQGKQRLDLVVSPVVTQG
ncbi:hypothetical protein D3C78_1315790 [compost metagenome]